MPGFTVLLFLLEAGGAWLLWRWIAKTTTGIAPDRAMASLSLFGIFALLLFLLGRFSVTIARLENHRLLRPSASFLLAGAYVCFRHGARHRRRRGGISQGRFLARARACACCSA